jgi:hypothetical protein
MKNQKNMHFGGRCSTNASTRPLLSPPLVPPINYDRGALRGVVLDSRLAAEQTQEAGKARATLGPASRRHRASALLVLEKRRCMSETAWLCTVGVIGIDECK